jgi:hypothetical protein
MAAMQPAAPAPRIAISYSFFVLFDTEKHKALLKENPFTSKELYIIKNFYETSSTVLLTLG